MGRVLKEFRVNVYMTDVEQFVVEAYDDADAEKRAKERFFGEKYRRDYDLVDFESVGECDDN